MRLTVTLCIHKGDKMPHTNCRIDTEVEKAVKTRYPMLSFNKGVHMMFKELDESLTKAQLLSIMETKFSLYKKELEKRIKEIIGEF